MLNYAKKLLIADEEIKFYTKRNEIVTFYKPVLVHLAALAVAVAVRRAAAMEQGWWLVVAAVLLPLPYTLYTWLWWRTKYYIVTNYRVMKVEGILNKVHRDASLDQINDLQLSEPLIGRILGWGHLQVLTANEESGVTYHYIKHPVAFKKAVTSWKEHAERYGLGPPPEEKTSTKAQADQEEDEDPISQIERLGELLRRGLITQEEFEAKKKELLKHIE